MSALLSLFKGKVTSIKRRGDQYEVTVTETDGAHTAIFHSLDVCSVFEGEQLAPGNLVGITGIVAAAVPVVVTPTSTADIPDDLEIVVAAASGRINNGDTVISLPEFRGWQIAFARTGQLQSQKAAINNYTWDWINAVLTIPGNPAGTGETFQFEAHQNKTVGIPDDWETTVTLAGGEVNNNASSFLLPQFIGWKIRFARTGQLQTQVGAINHYSWNYLTGQLDISGNNAGTGETFQVQAYKKATS